MAIHFNLTNHQLPLNLESVGNQWEQLSQQRPQGYPYYHWLQTESGQGEIWIKQQRILLNKGQGILIAPFIPHAYAPIDSDWHTNFLTFNGSFTQQLHTLFDQQTFLLANDSPDFLFSEHVKKIITLFETTNDPVQLSVLCYQFLLQLQQAHKPVQQEPLYQKYVAPALKVMQESYAQPLSIDELAKQLYISPQYFSRLFKRFIGQSPYQYLVDWRLRRAKELLINQTSLSIQAIAIHVGFDSTSQFIEMFKKKNQLTPRAFRKLY